MPEAAADNKGGGPLIVGRYALFDELAAGGMATVHLGRLLVESGPGRSVAVKRLHAQYARDPEFCAMFTDEARLVTRIKHPNVVRTVDVVQEDAGLFLVMEYVHGESLSRLLRGSKERGETISPNVVATLVHGVLLGLQAAHDVTGPDGNLLGVVHRDVSPQNVIIGVDGTAKVLDFGIAKAAGRMQTTREGQIKGKLAYMAPEQIRGQVDRRTDVFAASVVLWEALTGRRLHAGLKDVEIVTRIVQGKFSAPSTYAPGVPPELDRIVLKGLAPDPKKRYLSAKDMAADLEKIGLAERAQIGAWVERLAKPDLDKRAAKVAAMEEAARSLRPSEAAMRLPMPSTPEAFAPVSAVELSAGPRSAKDVRDELDAVAATMAPPATALEPDVSPSPSQKPSMARIDTPVIPMMPVQARLPPPVVLPPVVASDTGSAQLTPSGTAVPIPTRPPVPLPPLRNPVVIASLAASLAIALLGAAFGGYALAKRTSATPDEPRPVVPSALPSVAPVPAPPVRNVAADAGQAAITEEVDDEPSPTPSATAAPKPPPPPPPPKAKACDPPYVIDAQGNKRYKTECMGL